MTDDKGYDRDNQEKVGLGLGQKAGYYNYSPIFKTNDKEIFSNYRPISVLPCFSKFLEKLMYKRILKFLNKHDILFQN